MQTDDYFTKEIYKEMYEYEERQNRGLRSLAESIIKADKKIVIDIKTTGWSDYKRNEILKLSIIDTDNNILYDSFLKPERKFNQDLKFISQQTGIDPKLVANAPTIREQAYIINKILYSANTIIGYSLGKGMRFLANAGCSWRTDYDFVSIEDAFTLADNINNKNAALDDCAAYFGYNWINGSPHDTLDNCRAILYCYNKMLEEGWDLFPI